MTSKLTREQMLERARENVKALKMASRQHAFESAREEILADLQLAEYALARLDGVDSEPVVWVMLEDLADKDIVSTPAYPDINDAMEMTHGELEPLYRHAQQPVVDIEPTQMFGIGSIFKPQVVSEQEADCDDCAHYNPKICHGEGCPAISQQSPQPAPVVSEDLYKLANHIASSKNGLPDEWQDLAEELEADIRRTAMLQAQSDDDGEPTDDERIMAIEGIHNCERCGDEGWVVGEMGITRCACNQGNPVFKIDHNSDFIKHVKAVSEKVRAGNSPAHSGLRPEQSGAPPAQDGSSPAQNQGWIPVSERMPEGSEEVLCAKEFDGPGDWRKKVGYWLAGKWTVYGASWTPTHWMPLPAAPQEAK